MTDHPITPPPELVQQWMNEIYDEGDASVHFFDRALAARAAQWGADTELNACCEWLESEWWLKYDHEAVDFVVEDLRAARRPKPPSLKEQALQALENADGSDHPVVVTVLNADQHALIRRALEYLTDNIA